MFIDIEKFTDALIKSGLTANQFYFAYLVYKGKFNLMYKYVEKKGVFKAEDLLILEEKGYILNINKNNGLRQESYPDNFVPTQSFGELIMLETEELVEELRDAYPNFIYIEGKQIPAKNLSDLEKANKIYVRAIQGDIKRHNEILEITKWGADNKVICMGLEKYIINKAWEGLEVQKEEGNLDPYVVI